VTPKLVAAMIEQAQAHGWDAKESGTTRTANWNNGALTFLPHAGND
jgi:hypothetical protein